MLKLVSIFGLLVATVVHANASIPESYFTDNGGMQAALAGSP
jgi:hypothetical protein